jgi:hypothetical protein
MSASDKLLTPIYSLVAAMTSTVEYQAENPIPDDVWKWLNDGTVILWTHAGISIGKISGGNETWESGEKWAKLPWEDHLVELRAFNTDREWRIWRCTAGIRSRKRVDETVVNGTTQAIDAQMKLRGVVGEHLQAGSETLFLNTRNYLGMDDEVGTTRYVDVRFLGIGEYEKKGGSR